MPKQKVVEEKTPEDWPHDADHIVTTISFEVTETIPTVQYGNIQMKAWVNARIKPGEDWRPIMTGLMADVREHIHLQTHPLALRKIELARERINQLSPMQSLVAVHELVGAPHLMPDHVDEVKEALRGPKAFDEPGDEDVVYEDVNGET